jgi:Ca2+-binding EF-hand superfamily protein
VLERAGIELEPKLLNKLLDDLDPDMHGLVHWRAFVEGRIPLPIGRPNSLSKQGAGPYFLNGYQSYQLRQVLVASWNTIMTECDSKHKEELAKEQAKARKEQKEVKQLKRGSLDAKNFEACLRSVLMKQKPPPAVVVGTQESDSVEQAALDRFDKTTLDTMVKNAMQIANAAFAYADKRVNYHAFCQNYSQGDFNAERYIERKWESIYQQLKEDDEDTEDGLFGAADRDKVEQALERPEIGLSATMIQRLLTEFQEEDDHEEIKYIDLCWRFAKHNIQRVMYDKCLTFFRRVRSFDKARKRKIQKDDMKAVLRHAEIGLSES